MRNLPISSVPSVLLGVLVLGTLLAGCSEADQGAPAAPPPPAVEVVTLQAAPITLRREFPGRTLASEIAEVRPQVSGIIQKQLFDEGGLVEQGQPLYQLDDAIYRADLASAEAALKRAEAAAEAARLRAQRAAELVRTGALSAQDNETAIANRLQAQADVAAAKAVVQRARLDVAHARITAPIAGRIGTSNVTVGALVTANQAQPLATVQRLDPMHVDINAPVEELLRFRDEAARSGGLADPQGTAVDVLLPDGRRYPHPGRVKATDLSVDPGTGSFTLRVAVPNPEQALLPGMYVRTIADLGERPDGVLAPQRAIARDPKGNATALVVQADGSVEQRQVQTSQAIGDRWLIESGLAAGDRVIVAGLQRVQPGIRVEASEADSKAGAATAASGDEPPAAGADTDAPDNH